MKVALLTISHNNSYLLKNLIESIQNFYDLKEFDFYLFDNSSPNYDGNIEIAEKNNLIIFDNRDNKLNFKLHTDPKEISSGYAGSQHHSQAISYALNWIKNDKVILFDTDVYLTKPFDDILAELDSYISIGYLINKSNSKIRNPRIHPCFQLFNNKLRRNIKAEFHINDCSVKGLRDTGFDFYSANKSMIKVLGPIEDKIIEIENSKVRIQVTDRFCHFIGMSSFNKDENQYSKFVAKIINKLGRLNMFRFDIINTFIDKYKFDNYLEVGTATGSCYVKVKAKVRLSIDPDPNSVACFKMTSDEFFKNNKMKFDIIFIDGLHEHNQVYRDIQNSLKCLNKGGVIVMHDCHPTSEKCQEHLLAGQYKGGYAWTGDCWKAFVKARTELPYEMYVYDQDWGCGIIDTNFSKISDTSSLPTDMEAMTYKDFIDHPEWMNFKTELQIQGKTK